MVGWLPGWSSFSLPEGGSIDHNQKADALAAGLGHITLGGKALLVKQASLADLTAVRSRVRASLPKPAQAFADVAKSPVWDYLSDEDKKAMAKEAATAQLKGQDLLGEEAAFELIARPEHCRFLAWLLLRESNPALTRVELDSLIDSDNAAHVAWELLQQSGGLHLGNASSSPS